MRWNNWWNAGVGLLCVVLVAGLLYMMSRRTAPSQAPAPSIPAAAPTQPPAASAAADTSGTTAAAPPSPQPTTAPLAAPGAVEATAETAPVPHAGDAADDPAIWVHPTDPALSTIIGTDKQGGLAVYDLEGRQLQYLADGKLNNVDLRYNVPLGAARVALVTAGNRSDDTLAIYRVDPATRLLHSVAARTIKTLTVYGSCMYHSAQTGKLYYFVDSEEGAVEQYELFDTGAGQIDARQVRAFEVGSQTEGCVADDALGHFYIGEEDVGIWKYGAEPTAGTTRVSVDTTGSGGHLTADVEGLAIYDAANGQGYLLASSQGSNDFTVYDRAGANSYRGRFAVTAGAVDGVTETDGIDVTGFGLGPAFPDGLFVAQDVDNGADHQNFKLVPWASIAGALQLPRDGAAPVDPRSGNAVP